MKMEYLVAIGFLAIGGMVLLAGFLFTGKECAPERECSTCLHKHDPIKCIGCCEDPDNLPHWEPIAGPRK